jgi:hypothetical protein
MELAKTKTFWLGLVTMGAGIIVALVPDFAVSMGVSMSWDTLLITGFGLIFGRDALRKLGSST